MQILPPSKQTLQKPKHPATGQRPHNRREGEQQLEVRRLPAIQPVTTTPIAVVQGKPFDQRNCSDVKSNLRYVPTS